MGNGRNKVNIQQYRLTVAETPCNTRNGNILFCYQSNSKVKDDNFPLEIFNAIPDLPDVLLKSIFEYVSMKCNHLSAVNEADFQSISMHIEAPLCFPLNSLWKQRDFVERFKAVVIGDANVMALTEGKVLWTKR